MYCKYIPSPKSWGWGGGVGVQVCPVPNGIGFEPFWSEIA